MSEPISIGRKVQNEKEKKSWEPIHVAMKKFRQSEDPVQYFYYTLQRLFTTNT